MIALSLENLLALSLQLGLLVAVAAIVTALLRVVNPQVRYTLWQAVLFACVAVPWIPAPRVPGVAPASLPQTTSAVTLDEAAPLITDASHIDWGSWLLTALVAGIALRLAWIAIGCVRLRRLRIAGEPAVRGEYDELQQTIGASAEVRYLASMHQPVTFGLIHPVVLLPISLRDRPEAIRHSVVAHELVHVRRRDWCLVLVEELLRTACWFHPAMWWLISRVQQAREEVVDRTVVALTGRRREYLEALVAFADDVPLAPAFARRRHLFRRITLLSTEDVMSTRRLVASAVVLAVAVIGAGWTAVRAFPLRTDDGATSSQQSTITSLGQAPGPVEQSAKPVTSDNPVPKRVYGEPPLFPPSVEKDFESVTVTLRTTVDEAGNVAELRVAGFAFRRGDIGAAVDGANFDRFATNFDRFAASATFKDAAGTRVTAQSMRPTFEAFIEAAADAVRRWHYEPPRDGPIVFNTIVNFGREEATISEMAAPPRAGLSADGAMRIGGLVKPPMKIKDIRPVYPQEARDAHVQGVVIAEIRIEPDGQVSRVQIVRSIPALDEAAVAAIRQWEFMPTLLNGAAVPVVMTVTVQFSLQ
jgi:TonB family protein